LPYGEKADLEEMSQGDGGVSETSEEEGKALENASNHLLLRHKVLLQAINQRLILM
jgi:hypothetical protein